MVFSMAIHDPQIPNKGPTLTIGLHILTQSKGLATKYLLSK